MSTFPTGGALHLTFSGGLKPGYSFASHTEFYSDFWLLTPQFCLDNAVSNHQFAQTCDRGSGWLRKVKALKQNDPTVVLSNAGLNNRAISSVLLKPIERRVSLEPLNLGFRSRFLGKLSDVKSLALTYGAADDFVAPSL